MIETLSAFGTSIWQWFVENKDAITAFFMSGQFVSFLAACVALLKTVKQTKENTSSTDTLNKTLIKTNEMSESVTTVDTNVQALTEENANLRAELKTTEEKLSLQNDELTAKLNAIIEVQSIVYSTIRDDSVRQTVATLLNNARYNETNTKEQLQNQIDALRNRVEESIENVHKVVEEVTENVSNVMNAAENAKHKAQTLKNIHNGPTRY